jgi:hypothetical protein
MKLFNSIAIFDVFVVAETGEKAREALLAWIAEGMPPSEHVAVETRQEQTIRASWREQKPLVAEDVSDADFKQLKGKTTIEIFEQLYTKR